MGLSSDAARHDRARRAADADELYRKMLRWVARRPPSKPDLRLVPADFVREDTVLEERFCIGGKGGPVDIARVGRALEYLVETERLALVDDRWVIYRIAVADTGGQAPGFDEAEAVSPGFERPELPEKLPDEPGAAAAVQAEVDAAMSAWHDAKEHLQAAAEQRARAEVAQELAVLHAAEARRLASPALAGGE